MRDSRGEGAQTVHIGTFASCLRGRRRLSYLQQPCLEGISCLQGPVGKNDMACSDVTLVRLRLFRRRPITHCRSRCSPRTVGKPTLRVSGPHTVRRRSLSFNLAGAQSAGQAQAKLSPRTIDEGVLQPPLRLLIWCVRSRTADPVTKGRPSERHAMWVWNLQISNTAPAPRHRASPQPHTVTLPRGVRTSPQQCGSIVAAPHNQANQAIPQRHTPRAPQQTSMLK